MKNKVKPIAVVALILCAFMIVGCAKQESEIPATETSTAGTVSAEGTSGENQRNTEVDTKTYRVGMILSGPITDVGWNGPQYDGLREIEKMGAEIAYQESISVSDVADALYTYCDEGFDVIFLGTNYFEENALPIMAEYPNITFFIMNGTTTKDNVYSFQIADEQQGFMMGAIAAAATKSKNVGFVGGRESTPIMNGKAGFEQGVKYIDPNIAVNSIITGTNDDVTANKETAKAMIDAGADIVAPMCDNSALGVLEAAQEAGAYAVASGMGQNEVAPKAVLVTVVKNTGVAVKAAYEAFVNGELPSETLKMGANEGVIYLSDWYEAADGLSAEVKDKVMAAYAELAAGNIQINIG